MIEIELFYKIVEAEVLTLQSDYLKHLKRVPAEPRRRFFRRAKIPVEDKLLKGYNKGVKAALDVLGHEYKRFEKRLKKDEQEGKRF